MIPCSHELQEPGLAVLPEDLLLTKHTHAASCKQFVCKGAGRLSSRVGSPKKFPSCLRPREPRHCSFGLAGFSVLPASRYVPIWRWVSLCIGLP